MEKIIVQTATLACDIQRAFELFTGPKHLEIWLTVKANVQPFAGGDYELFWRPDDPENDSTIGCRILAMDAPYFLNFEWKGPVAYKHFMNDADPLTNVTVMFREDASHTKVTLIHTGWRNSEDWDAARHYFTGAWKGAFQQLAAYAAKS